MISALCWVPRGAAQPTPAVAEPTEEELELMKAKLEEEGDAEDEWEVDDDADNDDGSDSDMDADTALEQAKAAAAAITANKASSSSSAPADTSSLEAALKGLEMDKYDDEDVGENLLGRILGGSSRPGMAYYNSNEEDPYITLKDDSDSEADDYTIRNTDLLILTARNEDDVSNLEVWVYEEAGPDNEANIYVHHDIMLPAFPLCVAWMDCDPSGRRERANMIAVGTFDPAIEIWDLDVIDAVEPLSILGGQDLSAQPESSTEEKKKKKKKKKKKAVLKEGSHTDAVLGLAWNREYRNVLASASADSAVKVWDVAAGKCEHTLTHHTNKVQAVVWNPAESPVLLSGAFDQTACLADMRTAGSKAAVWNVTADVESLCWAPHAPTCFMVSTEDGLVACFDARAGAGSAPVYQLSAHDKPTCTMSFCPAAPGLLATASTDKKMKFWDVSGSQPSLLATQEMKSVGAVFSSGFCADAPQLVAAGGAKGTVQVLDIRSLPGVTAKFPALMQIAAPVAGMTVGGVDSKHED